MYRSSSVTTLPSKTTLLLISTLNFKCVTFQILHKSVQYWRRHQQLLLGYYTALVKGLLSVIRAKWSSGHFSRTTHGHGTILQYLKKRTSTS